MGKSTSAAWLLARLHAAAISTGGENTGQLIRRLRVADLITAIFAKRTEVLRGAMDARMLVLDDLGASYEHEWPLGELDGLVDARYERQRGTIVTTNLWPHRKDGGAQAFEARYPRLWSRLLDSSGPGLVTMGGGDLRRRGGPKR